MTNNLLEALQNSKKLNKTLLDQIQVLKSGQEKVTYNAIKKEGEKLFPLDEQSQDAFYRGAMWVKKKIKE